MEGKEDGKRKLLFVSFLPFHLLLPLHSPLWCLLLLVITFSIIHYVMIFINEKMGCFR